MGDTLKKFQGDTLKRVILGCTVISVDTLMVTGVGPL